MIQAECIDELADFAGIKPQIAAITERAMQGELDFESALSERVLLLRDLSEGAIFECLDTRIEPMPGARTLVETLKSKGCRTVLVTGGFHQFADPVAELLGFERVVANRLEVSGGTLTGGLVGSITDSSVKKAVLLEEVAERGDEAISPGDRRRGERHPDARGRDLRHRLSAPSPRRAPRPMAGSTAATLPRCSNCWISRAASGWGDIQTPPCSRSDGEVAIREANDGGAVRKTGGRTCDDASITSSSELQDVARSGCASCNPLFRQPTITRLVALRPVSHVVSNAIYLDAQLWPCGQ